MLANKNKPRAGLLLGVTNPIFEEACKHWPHVLSLGDSDGGGQKDVDDKKYDYSLSPMSVTLTMWALIPSL